MTIESKEVLDALAQVERSRLFSGLSELDALGIRELKKAEVFDLHQTLKEQLLLKEQYIMSHGARVTQNAPAIKINTPRISKEDFKEMLAQDAAKKPIALLNCGGTNWKTAIAYPDFGGRPVIEDVNHLNVPDASRQLTTEEFAQLIANELLKCDVNFSSAVLALGFTHVQTTDGVNNDVRILTDLNGNISKKWRFTDTSNLGEFKLKSRVMQILAQHNIRAPLTTMHDSLAIQKTAQIASSFDVEPNLALICGTGINAIGKKVLYRLGSQAFIPAFNYQEFSEGVKTGTVYKGIVDYNGQNSVAIDAHAGVNVTDQIAFLLKNMPLMQRIFNFSQTDINFILDASRGTLPTIGASGKIFNLQKFAHNSVFDPTNKLIFEELVRRVSSHSGYILGAAIAAKRSIDSEKNPNSKRSRKVFVAGSLGNAPPVKAAMLETLKILSDDSPYATNPDKGGFNVITDADDRLGAYAVGLWQACGKSS